MSDVVAPDGSAGWRSNPGIGDSAQHPPRGKELWRGNGLDRGAVARIYDGRTEVPAVVFVGKKWRDPIGMSPAFYEALPRKSHNQRDPSTSPDGKTPSGSAQDDRGTGVHSAAFLVSREILIHFYAANKKY